LRSANAFFGGRARVWLARRLRAVFGVRKPDAGLTESSCGKGGDVRCRVSKSSN
jgi:hypothetical protein